VRAPIFAVAAGASGTDRRRAGGDGRFLWTTRTGFFARPAFGRPTSGPSGGGSGARRRPGAARTAIRPTPTIAAARATPRHLIRTPPIARQGPGGTDLSPSR
jgi:hypothetical protein